MNKANEIIKRFDEVICEKASKFSVDKLNDSLKEYLSKSELDNLRNMFDKE